MNDLSISKKDNLSIVFIGHVDAGKSTIGGQVLNQLNLIDKRTLEKYKEQAKEKNRESWYLSWAFDTDEGEREKGKTVEVGRAIFEYKNKRIILLDAPGHSMYVSDMISGANLADIAILVVSARTNEFEAGFEKEGQTREHIYLSKAGGIDNILVLINKMDEVNWSEERYNFIKNRLNNFLSKFYTNTEISYIPISGFKGENILERKDCFYQGPSFIEYLSDLKVERDFNSYFSFTVVDKIKHSGVVHYEGKVETGKLTKSDVLILPRNINTSIANIYNDDDLELEEAYAGDFVRIKLKENFGQIEVGDLVMHTSCDNFAVSDEFVAGLTILEAQNIISSGYQCVLHVRMIKIECRITELVAMVDKKLVKKKFAKKGEKILAKIKTSQPIVLKNVTPKQTDKFALRNENMTVALGFIKKIIFKN
ncbi:translation elongation factor 1 alpha [Tubulinosema ratisbonensis]|uniref:Translation elongation factor 1 alpha n=1 Tax=Tubulinosema ratisbonensis TaxID=291195 RepID=A0A437AM87_9MICR|nr:translation elongation factor 1 alpha [Tubulinosema ratisbonensis]